MKIESFDDMKNLLRMEIAATAFSTALELHLFKALDDKPMDANSISLNLNIPHGRCYYWLELLVELGLLEELQGFYSPPSITRTAILKTYSSDSWAQLAHYARESYLKYNNLFETISNRSSVWKAQKISPPDWFKQIKDDPEQARRFTYLLYDLHQPYAETLANNLDMTGVKRIIDLGGGSGVNSLALLKKHSDLTAVVVDIPHVCTIGKEIAAKSTVADRITYHAADFFQDDLPTDIDMILQCDAGVYTEDFFRKLCNTLNKGGQLVIVDWLTRGITDSQPVPESSLQRKLILFDASLDNPDFEVKTSEPIKENLTKAGLVNITEQFLDNGTVIIKAQKPQN